MSDVSLTHRFLRLLYLATLLAIFFPRVLVGASGWTSLATGGGMVAVGLVGLGLLPVIGLAAWRFVHVIRRPLALASPPDHPLAATVRGIGVLLMMISMLASVGQFFIGPLTHMLLGRSDGGEAGIGYFVVSLGLYFVSGFGSIGILLFELGRWIARRAESIDPTVRSRAAGAVLSCILVLVIAHLGALVYVQSHELRPPRNFEPPPVDSGPVLPGGPIETVVSESSPEPSHTLPSWSDDSRTAEMTLPPKAANHVPQLLEDFHGPVRLQPQMGGKISDDRLTLSYCCAGAFSSAAATGIAPAGRSYMEAMFVAAKGQQTAHAHTRLGVTAAASSSFDPEAIRFAAPTSLLRSGDVLGVLIDTDRRRVEYYVRGERVSSRDLYNLRTTELKVWASVGAARDGHDTSDRWTVNFGAEPFVYPPSELVLTYEGHIHRP